MLKLSDGSDYKLFDVYWHHWHRCAERRAEKQSARYKEIRDSLRTAQGHYRWDSALMEEQHDIFWKVNHRPLYWYLHRVWEKHGLKAKRDAREVRSQRGERGWSDRDVWGLDHYLSGIMIGSIGHLRDLNHGFPANLTEGEWRDILDAMIDGFQASRDIIEMNYDPKDRPEYDALHARFENGMDLLKEYFFGLWD